MTIPLNAFRLALAVAVVPTASSTLAAAPHPPQLTVSFLSEPAPIVQNGATKLAYEMVLTNFVGSPYRIASVEVSAGEKRAAFEGTALSSMMMRFDQRDRTRPPADPLTLEGGRGAVVFFLIDLNGAKAPKQLAHRLSMIDDKGETHQVDPAPLPVSQESPIVVAPPLKGTWIAGNSLSNGKDAAHRRAMLVINGRAFIAQRYAIDWVQVQTVDGKVTTWKGPEDQNASYFCYDQPIYSVGDGTVADASDGMAENVPHSGKHAVPIGFDNAGGNHVVVEIAPHRYAFYAHMRPGTVRVKVGDRVHLGDILGHVGNSGSSEEPHLHFHIDDEPSFLAGDGVPFAFAKGLASGPVEANVASPEAVTFGASGPQMPFVDDYPAANALVTFE